MKKDNDLMEKIVSLCKRRGFIFQGSEIYGGVGSIYDYGSLGVLLKNNIKAEWFKSMVQLRDDVVGLDSAIIMNPKVWEASGHVQSFTDPLVDCRKCKKRFREDHLLEGKYGEAKKIGGRVVCPECGGELTESKSFNLLMETYLGVVKDQKSLTYLRGETCQGIYTNFKNVEESSRKKISFGIAQIGKAFRNEVTPGNFIFRMREFEQMEQQFFIKPDTEEGKKWFEYWKNERMKWYLKLGMKKENLRFRKHAKHELAHYAKNAEDIEYNTPFGWQEFEGIHNRGDWDLSRHSQFSGKDLSVFDEEAKKKYIPWIIETSAGADRATLMFILDAYSENDKSEVFLRLHPKLAPYKVAILPLVKNKSELVKLAREIYEELRESWFVYYDEVASIGRRYRRQDEIGTPWCVTVDFDSLEKHTVTIRDRDTMKQERIKIDKIKEFVEEKLK